MSRSEAKQLGLTKYNTGKPCKHGHMTYRYTTSGACKDCATYYMKKEREVVRAIRRAKAHQNAHLSLPLQA